MPKYDESSAVASSQLNPISSIRLHLPVARSKLKVVYNEVITPVIYYLAYLLFLAAAAPVVNKTVSSLYPMIANFFRHAPPVNPSWYEKLYYGARSTFFGGVDFIAQERAGRWAANRVDDYLFNNNYLFGSLATAPVVGYLFHKIYKPKADQMQGDVQRIQLTPQQFAAFLQENHFLKLNTPYRGLLGEPQPALHYRGPTIEELPDNEVDALTKAAPRISYRL